MTSGISIFATIGLITVVSGFLPIIRSNPSLMMTNALLIGLCVFGVALLDVKRMNERRIR